MQRRAFHVWTWGPFLLVTFFAHLHPLLGLATATSFRARNGTNESVWVSLVSHRDRVIVPRLTPHFYGGARADIEVPAGRWVDLPVDTDLMSDDPDLVVRTAEGACRRLEWNSSRQATITDLASLAPAPEMRDAIESYRDPSPIWIVLFFTVLLLLCLCAGTVLSKPRRPGEPAVEWP